MQRRGRYVVVERRVCVCDSFNGNYSTKRIIQYWSLFSLVEELIRMRWTFINWGFYFVYFVRFV